MNANFDHGEEGKSDQKIITFIRIKYKDLRWDPNTHIATWNILLNNHVLKINSYDYVF